MKRKLLACVLACTMVASLAGCGGSASQTATESKPAETTAAEQSQAAESTAPAEETTTEAAEAGALEVKSGITLNVTTTFAGEESNVQNYQDAVKRWEDKYGCSVADSSGSADETFKSRVISDFEAGAEPDVLFYFNGNDSNPFVEAGKVVTIDEIRSVYPDYASNMKDEMIPACPADNKKYAVPFYGYWEGMFVNKSVCEQAGAEIPGADTTWEEFMEICQKIKDAGYDPITVDDAYQQSMYGHYLAMIKDVDWVGELLTDKTGKLWDDPAILQMAEDFQELREKGYFAKSVGSNVFPAAQNGEFAMGTAAMYYNGSWLPNEVAEITGDDFQWGAMFFPAPEGSKYPYTTYTTGCQFYGVNKDCEHPEEAVALLAEFTSVKTQQALADEAQCIPVINGITLPDNLVCVGELMEESTDAFVWGGSNLEDADVRAIINASFTKLLAGDIDAPKFVEEIKSQLK